MASQYVAEKLGQSEVCLPLAWTYQLVHGSRKTLPSLFHTLLSNFFCRLSLNARCTSSRTSIVSSRSVASHARHCRMYCTCVSIIKRIELWPRPELGPISMK